MKGLSYQFFFKSVGEEIHHLETFIANNDFSTNDEIQHITKSLLKIIKLYDQEFDLVSKHLNIKNSIEFTTPRSISSKTLDDFFEKVKGTGFENVYFNDIYSIAIEELLSPYCDLTQELAGRLHKEVLPINFSGKEIRVHPTIYSSFFLSLNHIFRNILIHGIEDPYTREENGKNREGRITILVEDSLDSILLTIQDDGKGIDINKIKKKLKDIDHPLVKENIDKDELIQIIFEPSFSTSDNINEDSGRGVGLSAVKEEIQKLRGKIQVVSEVGNGTSFIITVPKFQN
jgi:two-component system chemotaxis sensor kinase CheA